MNISHLPNILDSEQITYKKGDKGNADDGMSDSGWQVANLYSL
jgi:hypothetical protein